MNLGKGRTLEFWWFPDKKVFDFFRDFPYDGYMHTALCLWVVNIGYRRPWTDDDFK